MQQIVFTRTDGDTVRERTAFSPAEAVALRFDGWTEKKPEPVEPPVPAPAPTSRRKPDTEPATAGE